MRAKNIAVLDTDFISKLYATKNKNMSPLIEKILELPFAFYCHQQTLIELECKETQNQCSEWLRVQNTERKLEILSDLDLINRMQIALNSETMDAALNMYRMFLQDSCNLFSSDFYSLHYLALESLEPHAKKAVIGETIRLGDESAGTKNNLGEIKAITMIHIFLWLDSAPVFQFLSDDTTARRMLIQDESCSAQMQCMSALGSFYILFIKGLLIKETANEYFDSWMELHAKTNQSTFKIRNANKGRQLEKIEGYSLFEKIFSGELEMGRDGLLQYCQTALT